jgi:hypothetical protein
MDDNDDEEVFKESERKETQEWKDAMVSSII